MNDWELPKINLDLCDRCGHCIDCCPSSAVEMVSKGPSIPHPADCDYCALCDAICPQGAITCSYEIVWGKAPESPNPGSSCNQDLERKFFEP